jgi:hypothetical protein
LRYTGADDSEPTTVQTNFNLLREQDLTVRFIQFSEIDHVINNHSQPFIPSNVRYRFLTSHHFLLLYLVGSWGAGYQDQPSSRSGA